jgi:hypothetical protein
MHCSRTLGGFRQGAVALPERMGENAAPGRLPAAVVKVHQSKSWCSWSGEYGCGVVMGSPLRTSSADDKMLGRMQTKLAVFLAIILAIITCLASHGVGAYRRLGSTGEGGERSRLCCAFRKFAPTNTSLSGLLVGDASQTAEWHPELCSPR